MSINNTDDLDLVSIESIASIAATLMAGSEINPHDAVLRSYELLEIAAAGKSNKNLLPESYKFGIEQHRQMMRKVRQLEMTSSSLSNAESFYQILEDKPDWDLAEKS